MLIVRWPWGSRSMRRTRLPSSASAHPRFTAVVVLPTPPFWLAIAMTLLKRCLDLCAGTWLALFNGNTGAPSSSALWTNTGRRSYRRPANRCRVLDPDWRHSAPGGIAAAMHPGWSGHALWGGREDSVDAFGAADHLVPGQCGEVGRITEVARKRLGKVEDLLGEEGHLLRRVRVIERDRVGEGSDRHPGTGREVRVQVVLEVVE